MQHVKGITLKEYLFRNRNLQLSYHYSQSIYNEHLRERLELFLHVCDAIEYSHHQKIIHCDLKPENIMISRYSEVYVMDWGIACFEGTQYETMAGTPAYMAPERIATGISNQQSDVFSLGMILNEVATLRPQLTGETTEDVLRKIRAGAYVPSTPIDPKRRISRVLRAIIEKARARDPQNRYATVKELADDVRHFMFHEEVSACPASLLEKAMHYLYRHRRTTVFLFLLFMMSVAGVILWMIDQRNKEVQGLKDVMIHNLRLQTNVET